MCEVLGAIIYTNQSCQSILDKMKGLTKLRPLGRIGSKHKNRYGQLGTKSRHGSDSDDSDFAEEVDTDYHSGMCLFNDYRMLRAASKLLIPTTSSHF